MGTIIMVVATTIKTMLIPTVIHKTICTPIMLPISKKRLPVEAEEGELPTRVEVPCPYRHFADYKNVTSADILLIISICPMFPKLPS